MKKKLFTLVIAAAIMALILALAGCGSKAAATVNGKAIPQSDVDKQIDIIKKQQKDAFKGTKGKELEKNFRKRILDQLITAELVKQEAEKRHIKVSKKEIEAKVNQVKKVFGNDQKKFTAALKQQGMTEDEYRNRVHDQVISEKMVKIIVKSEKVSGKDIKNYYEKNKEQFKDPEQMKISLILVKDKAKANKILSDIKGGADFAEQAKANSEDPSKDKGGDIGFRRVDEFPPSDAEMLKKLKIGEVSDVADNSGSYIIYKVEDKKDAKQKNFDEVKKEIKQRLLLEKQRAKFLSWIEEVKKKANIKQ